MFASVLTKRENYVVLGGISEETIASGLLQCTDVNLILSKCIIDIVQLLKVCMRVQIRSLCGRCKTRGINLIKSSTSVKARVCIDGEIFACPTVDLRVATVLYQHQ